MPTNNEQQDMQALRAALEILQNRNLSDAVYLNALETIGQLAFTSQIALILPTPEVEETEEVYVEMQQLLEKICVVLDEFILTPQNNEAPRSEVEAAALRGFIQTVAEVGRGIADESRQMPINKSRGTGLGKAIRSPYVFFPRFGYGTEKSFSEAVPCGGCAVIVKEFRGMHLRWVRRVLTYYVEPWYSRRRLIKKVVWILEWVPVQMIKTITVKCNGDKGSKTFIDKKVVVDDELQHFWRHFN